MFQAPLVAPLHLQEGNVPIWMPWVTPKDKQHLVSLFIQGLEPSKLQLVDIQGFDALSQLSEYTIIFDYPELLQPKTVLRASTAVIYDVLGNESNEQYRRAFTGIIWNLQQPIISYKDVKDNNVVYYRYQAKLVSKFHFLHYHIDSRIFVNKTVKDILNSILLDEHKLKEDFILDLEENGLASTFKIPVCVQYRESDWTFIQRLLMKVGVYFYVEQNFDDNVGVTNKIHFTDKMPEGNKLATEPTAKSLQSPNYRATGYDTDWVGAFNWQTVDHAMMSTVVVEGYNNLERDNFVVNQQNLDVRGAEVTDHPTYGHYYPQESFTTNDEAKKFAQVRLNQYNTLQSQASVSFNVPALSVMQKFSVNKKKGFDAAFGVQEGDYLVTGTNIRLSLIGVNGAYSPFEFTVNVIPLSSKTPALSPYFNLPAPEVTQTKLRAVVCNAQGAYDQAAVDQATRVMNDKKMRGCYVTFDFDQQVRTQNKTNTPVPVQYYSPLGIAALPMVGSWCLVEFLSFDQEPIFVGVHHHNKFQPFAETDPTQEMVLMAQPVNDSKNQNVNRIVLNDGNKIDEKNLQQLMSLYAPGKFNLFAAQGSGKAQFTIDEKGNIVLGNGSGANLTIKENGDIILANKQVTVTITAEGDFTVNANKGAGIEAKENIVLKTDSEFIANSNQEMQLQAAGFFFNAKGDAVINSSKNINLVAAGKVIST